MTGDTAYPGMKRIAGGTFQMESDRFYPEKAPVRRAWVGVFHIDEAPVTNADFVPFLAATGHVTLAEAPPDPAGAVSGGEPVLEGYGRIPPVRAFPANGYGLRDMISNVWEWTTDDYALRTRPARKCCGTATRRGDRFATKVLKGGSHLCAPNYCQRYRPAGRHPETVDTSTDHIGFRRVIRD